MWLSPHLELESLLHSALGHLGGGPWRHRGTSMHAHKLLLSLSQHQHLPVGPPCGSLLFCVTISTHWFSPDTPQAAGNAPGFRISLVSSCFLCYSLNTVRKLPAWEMWETLFLSFQSAWALEIEWSVFLKHLFFFFRGTRHCDRMVHCVQRWASVTWFPGGRCALPHSCATFKAPKQIGCHLSGEGSRKDFCGVTSYGCTDCVWLEYRGRVSFA